MRAMEADKSLAEAEALRKDGAFVRVPVYVKVAHGCLLSSAGELKFYRTRLDSIMQRGQIVDPEEHRALLTKYNYSRISLLSSSPHQHNHSASFSFLVSWFLLNMSPCLQAGGCKRRAGDFQGTTVTRLPLLSREACKFISLLCVLRPRRFLLRVPLPSCLQRERKWNPSKLHCSLRRHRLLLPLLKWTT